MQLRWRKRQISQKDKELPLKKKTVKAEDSFKYKVKMNIPPQTENLEKNSF